MKKYDVETMRLSEIDIRKLTDEEKLAIVMSGIHDIETEEVGNHNRADMIVVLGASPRAVNSRIKKMIRLVNKGFSNRVLLSGGLGWHRLFESSGNCDKRSAEELEKKRRQLLRDIREIINPGLLGLSPSEKEKALGFFNEDDVERKNQAKKEAQIMDLIVLSNGGLKGVKVMHEPFSDNTMENAKYAKSLVDIGVKRKELPQMSRIIIITSYYHCKRSALTFEKAFPGCEIIPCPSMDISNPDATEIDKECKRMIDYAKKGDLRDARLVELVGLERAKEIVERLSALELIGSKESI